MCKIVYITSHHWDTNRQGGFHKFAEYSADMGMETIFFSFPRPYYGYFMNREQLNPHLLKKLNKGEVYKTDSGNNILNITFSTFRIPDGIAKFFPDFIVNWLLIHSFKRMNKFMRKFFCNTDYFIFESCEGIALLRKIKKTFPNARIIYRPSDPMVFAEVPKRVKKLEEKILKTADMNFIVNEEGLEAYKRNIPNFDSSVKHQLLSNGIDIESYLKKYNKPVSLQKENTLLYVGAWDIEWNLIFSAANKTPNFNYIIVCPNYPSNKILSEIKNFSNIDYIPGIKPSEVPAWITNSDVIIVPYRTNFYKDRPLGITAKYYQAMAAEKPIVAYSDTPKLKDVGITVTYNYEDFIEAIKIAINKKNCTYNFNLTNRTWQNITKKFLEELKKL